MSKTITVDGVEYAPVADQTPTVRRIVIAQRRGRRSPARGCGSVAASGVSS